ncbi:MAG TPA: hypothetical protein VEW95_12100, partial [Candidatus Limnocylindrales bacterium]|nr:hypothetical protein [Candidatus Limnocylindrales bacterium]
TFSLRFGSIIPLAGIAIAGLLVGNAAARGSIARAVGLCAVLLLPHAIHATTTTGTPWGIVSAAQRATGDGAGADALLAYAALLPGPLMGPLAGVLAILGIVAVARAAVSPGSDAALARFLGIAAIGPMVVLVASSHAEPRYAIVPITLLATLGATRIGPRLDALAVARPALRAAVAGLALAVLVGGAVMTLIEIDRRVAVWDWTRDVALAIDADAGGAECATLASDAPIMAWYGRCAATTFGSPPSFDAFDARAGARGYIVLRADGHHQPPAAAIDALRDRVEPWRTFTDRNGTVAATVYRTRDDPR